MTIEQYIFNCFRFSIVFSIIGCLLQIINIGAIYREYRNSNKSGGSVISSFNNIGTIPGGIFKTSNSVECCPLREISYRLKQLILRENLSKAEYEVRAFDRLRGSRNSNSMISPDTNSSVNISPYGLTGEVMHDCNFSNCHSFNPATFSHSTAVTARTDRSGSFGSYDAVNRSITTGTTNHLIPPSRLQNIKPTTQSVSLIILDNQSISVSDKERDRAVSGGKALATLAAKEKIQIEKKVLIFANSLWGNCVVSTIQSQRIRGNHTVPPLSSESFVVVACELPFHLIRDLGSIILKISASFFSLNLPQANSNSNSNPNSFKNVNRSSLEIFFSLPTSLPFKKILKATITELSHFTVLSSRNSHPGSVLSSSILSTIPIINTQNQNRDIFLYSIVDDKYDLISYSPTALSRMLSS